MASAFDTCVLVDTLRDKTYGLRQRFQALADGGETLHLSAIVLHELMFGAQASARPDLQRDRVQALCNLFRLEDWTSDDAISAAAIRAELKRRGETIGFADALIAGQAVNRGWTLITSNARKFSRIENLKLENWSA